MRKAGEKNERGHHEKDRLLLLTVGVGTVLLRRFRRSSMTAVVELLGMYEDCLGNN